MAKLTKIILSILKWLLIIGLSLIALLFISMEAFDYYLSSDKGTQWLYKGVSQPINKISHTKSGVRYLTIGEEDKQPLLLIHGAPGGSYDWIGLAKQDAIYDQYKLIIVERPGYFGTKPRKAEKSILVQTQRILEVLDLEEQKAVVMGHSYGAPIAVLAGALAPDKIDRVIGLSGQYDPSNEIVMGISHWVNFKIFRYLIPRYIWSANVEKLSHAKALEDIVPYYAKVAVPVILIHGDKDTLVYYENSPYLMAKLLGQKELITLAGKDHPIHMQEASYLADFLIN